MITDILLVIIAIEIGIILAKVVFNKLLMPKKMADMIETAGELESEVIEWQPPESEEEKTFQEVKNKIVK